MQTVWAHSFVIFSTLFDFYCFQSLICFSARFSSIKSFHRFLDRPLLFSCSKLHTFFFTSFYDKSFFNVLDILDLMKLLITCHYTFHITICYFSPPILGLLAFPVDSSQILSFPGFYPQFHFFCHYLRFACIDQDWSQYRLIHFNFCLLCYSSDLNSLVRVPAQSLALAILSSIFVYCRHLLAMTIPKYFFKLYCLPILSSHLKTIRIFIPACSSVFPILNSKP